MIWPFWKRFYNFIQKKKFLTFITKITIFITKKKFLLIFFHVYLKNKIFLNFMKKGFFLNKKNLLGNEFYPFKKRLI